MHTASPLPVKATVLRLIFQPGFNGPCLRTNEGDPRWLRRRLEGGGAGVMGVVVMVVMVVFLEGWVGGGGVK